jgi:methylated-DNA-[protein]-cysteine S-methyltransferase
MPPAKQDLPAHIPVALTSLDTPVGPIMISATETGVSSVAFGDDARQRAWVTGGRRPVADPRLTGVARDQLIAYFAGTRRDFDLCLDWDRVPSRASRATLETLLATVPYGETVTYGELARRVSTRGGPAIPARAVGAVMGANPLPIVVPCHRVVSSTGLGGYSGGHGPELKRWLLTHEGALPPTLDFAAS